MKIAEYWNEKLIRKLFRKGKDMPKQQPSEFADRLYKMRTATDTMISETDRLREEAKIHEKWQDNKQDIHKLHTHPRLECSYGLGNTHVIIDYSEYVKAKEREDIYLLPLGEGKEEYYKARLKDLVYKVDVLEKANQPPFTATPEDHYKARLIEQSKTIGDLQIREKELSDEVLRLHKRLKPTPEDHYKHTKAELKHYKERYFQQVETIRDYQEETKKYKARMENFDISMEARRVTIDEYRKDIQRLQVLLNNQAMNFATVEVARDTYKAKSNDLNKLVSKLEQERDYHQSVNEGYKKRQRMMSMTIDALKTSIQDGLPHFKETYYKARIEDLEAQVESKAGTTKDGRVFTAKEYCGDEEIRPMFADHRSDTFQFANFCPECNSITWTTKAFKEPQICSNCYSKCETPEEFTDKPVEQVGDVVDNRETELPRTVEEHAKRVEFAKLFPYRGKCPKCKRETYCNRADQVDSECYECETSRKKEEDYMTDDEIHEIVWSGCSSYTVSKVNYNKIKEAIEEAKTTLEDQGKFRFWPILKCNEPIQEQKGEDMEEDLIAKPNHYNWHPSGIECKDIVKEFIYNKGTAIAYIWRSAHKGTEEQDLQKAVQHLQFELERIKEPKKNG